MDRELEEYRKLGTAEQIKADLDELKRWRTTIENTQIQNRFARYSTLVCANCAHKDEYIEELEAENGRLKKELEMKKIVQEDKRKPKEMCGFIRYFKENVGELDNYYSFLNGQDARIETKIARLPDAAKLQELSDTSYYPIHLRMLSILDELCEIRFDSDWEKKYTDYIAMHEPSDDVDVEIIVRY